MKIATLAAIAILAGTFPLGAQSAAPAQSTTTLQFTLPPAANTCPVSLRAQHLSDGNLFKVGDGHPKGVGQWLHLTLVNPPSREIARATITVHGFSNKARVTQTSPHKANGADAVQTLTVRFSAGPDKTASGDVWVPGMTAVVRIDLDAVTYTDGLVRRFTASESCRVTPDPFMLIADN